MIVGLIAIFTVLVIRLQSPVAIFPEITALPEGTQVLSVSRTANELIVIDQNRKIYLLSLDGEKLLHMQALPFKPMSQSSFQNPLGSNDSARG